MEKILGYKIFIKDGRNYYDFVGVKYNILLKFWYLNRRGFIFHKIYKDAEVHLDYLNKYSKFENLTIVEIRAKNIFEQGKFNLYFNKQYHNIEVGFSKNIKLIQEYNGLKNNYV